MKILIEEDSTKPAVCDFYFTRFVVIFKKALRCDIFTPFCLHALLL